MSPLELLDWPTVLVEGFQVYDIVELKRSLACACATGTGDMGRNLSAVE